MADIKTPFTAAMKARAKAAIDATEGEPDYSSRTPRELRHMILRQDDSDDVRAAMRKEGWFAPAQGEDFLPESNKSVKVA